MKAVKKQLASVACAALFAVGCSNDDNAGPSVYEARSSVQTEIPDSVNGSVTSVTSVLEVTTPGIITHPEKFSITLELEHGFAGDLVVQLITPDGAAIPLIKRIGSVNPDFPASSANFVAGNFISFSPTAEQEIITSGLTTTAVIPAGNYLPTGANATEPANLMMQDLTDFLTGQNVEGEWRLQIGDFASDDSGSLLSWKITIEPGAFD